jgi:hypothetical protein
MFNYPGSFISLGLTAAVVSPVHFPCFSFAVHIHAVVAARMLLFFFNSGL